MQQTEKYQFNLIEGSDTFLPEALNENMEKAEAALEGKDAALAAHAADTAARFAQQPKVGFVPFTGTGGGKVILTFPFQPRMVLLAAAKSESLACFTAVYGQTGGYRTGSYSGIPSFDMEWSGNTLTLKPNSNTGSPTFYFNQKDTNYLAVAFG